MLLFTFFSIGNEAFNLPSKTCFSMLYKIQNRKSYPALFKKKQTYSFSYNRLIIIADHPPKARQIAFTMVENGIIGVLNFPSRGSQFDFLLSLC
jgi:hypothetical protein